MSIDSSHIDVDALRSRIAIEGDTMSWSRTRAKMRKREREDDEKEPEAALWKHFRDDLARDSASGRDRDRGSGRASGGGCAYRNR